VVAQFFEVDEQMPYRWSDPTRREQLSVGRALRMTHFLNATAFAEAFAAAAGGLYVPVCAESNTGSLLSLGVESNQELADLIMRITKALDDGKVTQKERDGLLLALDVLLRTLCAMRANLTVSDEGGAL